MKVENLTPWSGKNFLYKRGDVIELPDPIAEARIAAGLARLILENEKPRAVVKRRGRKPKDATTANTD